MASVKERVYLADSKISVRRKMGLDEEGNDEDFSKFENICSNVYRFKLVFDPKVNWSHLDKSITTAAESMIANGCRKEKLRLGASDSMLRELIEWKLYQNHRAAQRKGERQSDVPQQGVAGSTKGAGSSTTEDTSRKVMWDPARNL